jgi:hypothetical protein
MPGDTGECGRERPACQGDGHGRSGGGTPQVTGRVSPQDIPGVGKDGTPPTPPHPP